MSPCGRRASSESMVSFGYAVVDFGNIRSCWVHLGALLATVVFIPGRWVQWSAPLGSLGSFVVAGFIGVHPVGRRDHLVSLDYWRSALGSPGPSRVDGFIGVRPGGRRVHQGMLGS